MIKNKHDSLLFKYNLNISRKNVLKLMNVFINVKRMLNLSKVLKNILHGFAKARTIKNEMLHPLFFIIHVPISKKTILEILLLILLSIC